MKIKIVKDSNLHEQALLIPKNGNVPGLIIDDHQSKHLPNWGKGGHKGGKGSLFKPVSLQRFKALAHVLVGTVAVFFQCPNTIEECTPKKFTCVRPKEFKDVTAAETVSIHAGFNLTTGNWEIHLFPED